MNIVIGKSGQVARALGPHLQALEAPALFTSSRSGSEFRLDLGDAASIESCFREFDRRGIKNAKLYLPGALTNVDRCEKERELCRRINTSGPELVGRECVKRGWPLAFFSTEYVYGQAEYDGGPVGPFSENDPPAPSSFYGACKLEAEEKLKALGLIQLLILRTTMVFSYDPEGLNFFMQLYRHLKKLQTGEEGLPVFKIAVDQISTPTFAPSLAKNSVQLMEKGESGIFNLVGAELLSRKELLEKIIDAFGFDRQKVLRGFAFLETRELGQAARRPLTAGLACDKARARGLEVLSLDEAFRLIKGEMAGRF